MSNSFGENIRRFRAEKGLKQPHFAEAVANMLNEKNKCDFAKSVSKWENGDNYPKMEVIIAIAELMGVTLDELFNDEIAKFKADCAERIACRINFSELSSQEIDLLYSIFQGLQFDMRSDKYEPELADEDSVFYGCLTVKTEKNGEILSLILDKEDFPLKKEIPKSDEVWKIEKNIENWMRIDVLGSYFKQKVIYRVGAYHVTNAENLYVVTIDFDLREQDIEEFLIEYAKRDAKKKARILIEEAIQEGKDEHVES